MLFALKKSHSIYSFTHTHKHNTHIWFSLYPITSNRILIYSSNYNSKNSSKNGYMYMYS